MATPTPAVPPAGDPAPVTASRTTPLRWFARGGWYVFVVVLSLGMLSFVPFVHAAIRTRKPLRWLWAGLYTAAVITMFILTGTMDIGGFLIALMILASIHAIVLRPHVWPNTSNVLEPTGHAGAATSTDPAVAAVLAARARREEARRLASADPQMARELGIGRPDLGRAYDDGGLVDLNKAPMQAIAQACGIEPAVAETIAEARAAGITFMAVNDLFAFTEIPYTLWDRIRDRALVIR